MSESRPKSNAAAANAATFLGVFFLLGVVGALLALAAMVNPGILGILVVVFGMGFMMLFHYLVWGWWLTAQPSEEDEPRHD